MHGMPKRAAAGAIPALLGLAVSPASAMVAPHTSRAVAGPVMGGREVHERLAQLPLSGMIQGRLAGTVGTAETTADTCQCNGTDAKFAATPATPVSLMLLSAFTAIPVSPDAVTNGGPISGPANGINVYGKDDKIVGNRIFANGGAGIDNSHGETTGNGALRG